MFNIQDQITVDQIKKIFNKENAEKVLDKLEKGLDKKNVYKIICEKWNYEYFKNISREIAFSSGGKYDTTNLPSILAKRDEKIAEYKTKYPQDESLDWVFKPDSFDSYRKKITFNEITEEQFFSGISKHKLVAEISDLTSKITETVIVKNNEGIFPTLKNSKGVDYFYLGQPRDLKNSKSLGGAFISYCEKNGLNPIEEAIKNPQLVIKSLYENQTESRFGFETRHLIVTMNNNILSNKDLLDKLNEIDLDNIHNVNFNFKGKEYTTTALITYI